MKTHPIQCQEVNNTLLNPYGQIIPADSVLLTHTHTHTRYSVCVLKTHWHHSYKQTHSSSNAFTHTHIQHAKIQHKHSNESYTPSWHTSSPVHPAAEATAVSNADKLTVKCVRMYACVWLWVCASAPPTLCLCDRWAPKLSVHTAEHFQMLERDESANTLIHTHLQRIDHQMIQAPFSHNVNGTLQLCASPYFLF